MEEREPRGTDWVGGRGHQAIAAFLISSRPERKVSPEKEPGGTPAVPKLIRYHVQI